MFERHFGLRENPFHSGHQMRFLYPSREHQEARAHLRYGIENREPFVLITGEVGTGKTTALYDALAEWGSQVAVALITNSALSREELIEEIALRFGLAVTSGTSKPQALSQLERHLLGVRARGEHAVLLLDEAQNLANDLLEEIRLLSNLETHGEKLVQIFLVGQPELEAKLGMPQLRQLRQRITVHYRLNPLSPEETIGYIHHRIAVAGGNPFATFPPETCREIYRLTHGIPREINTVASQALIAAFSEGAHTVRVDHVQAIAREYQFRSVMGAPAELGESTIADAAPAAAEPPAAAAAPATPAPIEPPAPESHAEPIVEPAVEPHVEPAAEPAPPWTPPELETEAPAEEPVEHLDLSELDAWTRAAQELLAAKRRGPASERERLARETSAPAEEPASLAAEPVARADEEELARFPSRAELHARGASAQPDSADLSGLPERLRARIARDIEREERPRSALPAVLAAVAVVALAVVLVLLQRFQVIDLPLLRGLAGNARSTQVAQRAITPAPTPRPATSPASVTPHDSLAAPHDTTHAATPPGASVTAPAPVASAPAKPAGTSATQLAATKPAATPVVAAKPNATPPAIPAATKPAPEKPPTSASAAAAPAKPATPANAEKPTPASSAPRPAAAAHGPLFGVGIAHYLDADRAQQERDHYAGVTKLPAVVVPYKDGTTTMYRVVLGNYASNAAAEKGATQLMERYGVSEALVCTLRTAKPKAN